MTDYNRGLYSVSVGETVKEVCTLQFAREVAYKTLRDKGEGIAYVRLNGSRVGEVVRYRCGVNEWREYDRLCEQEHGVKLLHVWQLRSDGRLGKYLGGIKQ